MLNDIVISQEESSSWAKQAVDVASVMEDADVITKMHDAVLGNKIFAVDAPDGEHDLEDVVSFQLGFPNISRENTTSPFREVASNVANYFLFET